VSLQLIASAFGLGPADRGLSGCDQQPLSFPRRRSAGAAVI